MLFKCSSAADLTTGNIIESSSFLLLCFDLRITFLYFYEFSQITNLCPRTCLTCRCDRSLVLSLRPFFHTEDRFMLFLSHDELLNPPAVFWRTGWRQHYHQNVCYPVKYCVCKECQQVHTPNREINELKERRDELYVDLLPPPSD